MIRGGFLSDNDRRALIGMARDGLVEHRIARRANAMVLLDQGWSCERVAAALLLDDDTVRNWHRAYERGGVEGLKSFGHEGEQPPSHQRAGNRLERLGPRPVAPQHAVGRRLAEADLWAELQPPGADRLAASSGFDYRKPEAMPRGLDDAKQQAFIDGYENLLNTMDSDEAVVFVDAVHPTHQVRPVGCWAPKGVAIAVEQTTGRDRLNIHGAINLETGRTQILDVERVDGPSLIKLLEQVESAHPRMRRIHVFLDNATYHRAVIVKEWLARPDANACCASCQPTAPISIPSNDCGG